MAAGTIREREDIDMCACRGIQENAYGFVGSIYLS